MHKKRLFIPIILSFFYSCSTVVNNNPVKTPIPSTSSIISSSVSPSPSASTKPEIISQPNSETLIKVQFKGFSRENLFTVINNKGNGFIFKGWSAKYIEDYKITDREDIFSKYFPSTYTGSYLNDEGNGLIAWDTGFSGLCSASNVYAVKIENYHFSTKEHIIQQHACLPNPEIKLSEKGDGEIQWNNYDFSTKILETFSKKVNNFQPTEQEVILKSSVLKESYNDYQSEKNVINSSGNGFVVSSNDGKKISIRRITNNQVSEQFMDLYTYNSYGSPPSASINESGNGIIVWSDYISENGSESREQVFVRIIKNYQVL